MHPFCTPSASQIKKRIPVRIKVLTIQIGDLPRYIQIMILDRKTMLLTILKQFRD
uniref:Uncharacterized protein n=1 Tax=Siphoviridae sp. ctYkG6 TaxID=2825551 RepID=A0A8S5VC56_9CAUD|nr:MAG TPA: hypothetical protein [Siphoviridae sp. ctYkG6]